MWFGDSWMSVAEAITLASTSVILWGRSDGVGLPPSAAHCNISDRDGNIASSWKSVVRKIRPTWSASAAMTPSIACLMLARWDVLAALPSSRQLPKSWRSDTALVPLDWSCVVL